MLDQNLINNSTRIEGAIARLSKDNELQFHYDPVGQIHGDGPIHFLVEIDELLFIAWEDTYSKTMIVNPVTRFDLEELDEVGANDVWSLVRLPHSSSDCIQFGEMSNSELSIAYKHMERCLLVSPHY